MTDDSQKLDISTFLLASVHDMKNSLGLIASHLEAALAEPTDMDASARQKTVQALYETQRVNNHLIQLLALYKIEQTFYPFDPQEQPIADLALEALARALPVADSKHIQLECECPEDLYGWFDYELVIGVVVQALHNALNYSRSRVLLSGHAHGSGVAIRIEDDGPGYPEFLLAQGNGARRGISFETGSTGLGLYFADIVAHLHRAGALSGRICLENGGRFGGGCFVLELP